MGHHITAIVLAGDVDPDAATEFDSKLVDCLDGFSLVALDENYVDTWAERLDIHGVMDDEPIVNFRVVHHIANALGGGRPFAIIETDYHGGHGAQAAAVYHGDSELMAPVNNESGAINDALRILGVVCHAPMDEFDTLGLGNYRHWDDLLDDYWDGESGHN